MHSWYVQLLGPVAVLNGPAVYGVGGPTARAVLAALALRGRAGASVDELMAMVWAGPDAVSRDSAYHYVKKLRGALADPAGPRIVSAQGRYRLDVDDDAVDVRQFERLVQRARTMRRTGDVEAAIAQLSDALGRWQGAALDGIGGRLAEQRLQLTDQRLVVLEELATLELQCGRAQRVYDLLATEQTEAPQRELMSTVLIRALTSLGRREEAGAVFHRTRRYLGAELGLDPSAALTAAYRDSLEGEGQATVSPAGPVPASAVPAGASAPLSGLPRQDRYFVGRERELDDIRAAMSTRDRLGAVCAIFGMPGVGKTALATRAAALLADEFTGGCLFVDLRGPSPDSGPLDPGEALDRILRRLATPGECIPSDLGARSSLYRSLVADRRILVVLDNASTVAQVGPLLPEAADCGVIITSRVRLAALDVAHVIDLDVLAPTEAATLFHTVIGPAGLRGETDAERLIGRIVARCGALPLAVRIAAARHRARPVRTLDDLDTDLADAQSVLRVLNDGERSVGASLTVSLADLPAELRRTFALLSIHPGRDFDAYAAGALAGVPLDVVAERLDALAERHLLTEHVRGRFRFHDLVAAFARERAGADLSRPERSAALRRLVDFYLRAADRADAVVTPHRARVRLDLTDSSAPLPMIAGYDAASAWLSTEHPNVADVCAAASEARLDTPCWQLAFLLRGFCFLTKLWEPWYRTHRLALDAARRSGDQWGEAITYNNLGLAHVEQRSLAEARAEYREAVRLFRSVGDERGENTARANQAWILFEEHRYPEFLEELRGVLEYYRSTGLENNVAITLRGIGLAETQLGRYREAVAHLSEALDIVTRLDVRPDMTMTLNALGEAHLLAGDLAQAEAAHRHALSASERCGSVYENAHARHRLGDVAARTGDVARAREHWARALEAYRQLGVVQSTEVEARLAG